MVEATAGLTKKMPLKNNITKKNKPSLFINLGSIVPHIIERPGIFDNQDRDPLRLIMVNEHDCPEYQRESIYNEKNNIKIFLMTRSFFVIGNIEEGPTKFAVAEFEFHIIPFKSQISNPNVQSNRKCQIWSLGIGILDFIIIPQ